MLIRNVRLIAVVAILMVVAVMMLSSLLGVYFYLVERKEGPAIQELEVESMREARQS